MRPWLLPLSFSFRRRFAGVLGVALGLGALSWSGESAAHFTLMSPPSWVVEDAFGNPQKIGPCGGVNATETETVTSYRAGSTINVRWKETVGHPGHFRISLARSRDDLIVPEVETSTGDGATGLSLSAEIMATPAYPVLLDGLFAREGVVNAQTEPFDVEVKLPDETCESCTLQVLQFMSNHEPGFFYYHCADVRIVAADAVLPPTAGASGSDEEADEGGGGCSIAPGPRPFSAPDVMLALGLGVALWRRRLR